MYIVNSLTEKAAIIKDTRKRLLNNYGENFNIFSALHLEYDEARLHSRLIAELLNPEGVHGQKTLFLEKFLELLNLPGFDTSFINQAKVYTEEHIGPISIDYMSGGLIDIVVKLPQGQVIVIENKINAVDQIHQLIRYKNAYPNAYIIYLTKNGYLPAKISTHNQVTGQMAVDFNSDPKHICISFAKNILEWLECCYQMGTRLPLIRETLHQYIATIKKITNQLTDSRMSNEMADAILSSNAHLDGFFTMRNKDVVKAVESKLLYKLIDETTVIAQGLGLIYDESNIRADFGHKVGDTEITFNLPGSQFCVTFGFDTWKSDFSIGVSFVGEKDEMVHELLSARLSSSLGNDAKYPKYYYLLYLKNSKLGHEYLSVWSEGSFEVWGKVNDGTVAKQICWYFETFLKELKEAKLIIESTPIVADVIAAADVH